MVGTGSAVLTVDVSYHSAPAEFVITETPGMFIKTGILTTKAYSCSFLSVGGYWDLLQRFLTRIDHPIAELFFAMKVQKCWVREATSGLKMNLPWKQSYETAKRL